MIRFLFIALFCLLVAGAVILGSGLSIQSIELNNEAVENLNEENSYFAYKKIVTALEDDPFNPYIQINLGLAFLLNKEHDKAIKIFSSVARSAENNSELKFQALFNAGVASAQSGKISLALEYYQQALEIKPDSQEVKTNIELLWQGNGQGKGNSQSEEGDQDEGSDSEDKQKGNDKEKKKENPESENRDERENEPSQEKLGKEALSQEQIQAILQEIKNQEQKIRAEENKQGTKEAPNGKDW